MRGEPELSGVWGGGEQGCAGSAPRAVTRGARGAQRPGVGFRQRLRGQGTALEKGSASPFIREETGLKRVQDLPQTTSKGAGIQIQIVFDSKFQTVLHILVPETKNWIVLVYLCFIDSSTVL